MVHAQATNIKFIFYSQKETERMSDYPLKRQMEGKEERQLPPMEKICGLWLVLSCVASEPTVWCRWGFTEAALALTDGRFLD